MKKVMILAVMAFTCLSFSSAMSMQQVANADCAKHQCEKCIKTSACQEKCKEGKDACKSECKEHKGECKGHKDACKSKCKEHKAACKSECKEHKGGCKSGCKK